MFYAFKYTSFSEGCRTEYLIELFMVYVHVRQNAPVSNFVVPDVEHEMIRLQNTDILEDRFNQQNAKIGLTYSGYQCCSS